MSIFDKLPPPVDEIYEILHKQDGIEIAHIVSSSRLPDIEYDQDSDEFVIILEGEATLEIKGERKELKKGEHIYIKAHTKHKILKTKNNTHWLAVYIKNKTN